MKNLVPHFTGGHWRKHAMMSLFVALLVLALNFGIVRGSTIIPTWTYVTDMPIQEIRTTEDGSSIIVGASTSENGTVYKFNSNGEIEWTYHLPKRLDSMSISPEGNYTVVGTKGGLYMLDREGNFIRKIIPPKVAGSPENTFHAVTVSPLGSYIATECNGIVILYDINGNMLWTYPDVRGYVSDKGIAFSRDEKYVTVGFYELGVYMFDIHGQLLWKFTKLSQNIRVVTFIGGNYIAIGTSANDYSSGNVYIFDINGSMVWNYTTEGGVSDIFASQDGNYITVGTEKSGLGIVYLFTKDGKLIWAYNTGNPVNGVLVNDNGSYIISVGGSGFYRFNKQGNILSSYRTSSSLHYVTASRDLQVVVFGSLNKLYFVNFSSKLVPAVLKIETNPPGSEVYLNGKYWGTAPLDIQLSPGTYTLKIIKDGYSDYISNITLASGETRTISATLKETIASMTSPPETSTTSSWAYTKVKQTYPTEINGTSGRVNPIYIVGVLIALIALWGVVAKVKGKTPESPPPAETINEPSSVMKIENRALGKSVPDFPLTLLERYEPLEFLGEGGFAKVFKARRKSDGKIVAVKIPRIDEKTSKTFIKEVSAWLQLNHKNIVKLHDVDILPVPYLEMEFVEGVIVDGKLARDLDEYPKPIPEKEALRIIRGVAEGLRHAHKKRIYHRDLKPQNILLKEDLTPKITDWGLAKVGTMSSSRSVLGYTPLYAAPEHLMPSKYGHTDAQTDVWQLGITFYELLTGKLPFEGYTHEEIFGKIVDEGYPFTPPSKFNPELAKYNGIFKKLLAKKKEERYRSVDEFLKDLERLDEIEERKAELDKEIEELRKTLSKSVTALKESKSAEEALRNRRLVVETLGKLALAFAELNRKAELLNALNDFKFYTVQNLTDLANAIGTVEMLIREDLPISDDFVERLKVLVHNIGRENGA